MNTISAIGENLVYLFSGRVSSPRTRPKSAQSGQAPMKLSKRPPRLHALVIGIDHYDPSSHRVLEGAVRDSNEMVEYLVNILGVEKGNINILQEAGATRSAIIKGFNDLRENKRISVGDPILIYFAGHGGTMEAPTGWIQFILPHDHLHNVDGQQVSGIPDYTIGELIDGIAEHKGDNITVIFDCCFAGSGTRKHQPGQTTLIRSAKVSVLPPDFAKKFMQKAGRHRASDIAPGFYHSGLRSHMLFAACGSNEFAHEENGRGIFTNAFLQTLVEVGSEKTTYAELIKRIPDLHVPTSQNPQCEGCNRDRVLFDWKAPVQGRLLYPIRRDGDNYVIEVGAVHGITTGAKFAIYESKDYGHLNSSIGVLEVDKTDGFSAIATGSLSSSLRAISVARQERAGKDEVLSLHVLEDDNLLKIKNELETRIEDEVENGTAVLVESKAAELQLVALENGKIRLNILDEDVKKVTMGSGLTSLPYEIDLEDIGPVIRAVAHYRWHLRRAPRSGRNGILQRMVNVQLTKVEPDGEELDQSLRRKYRPVGENLVHGNNVVDVIADKNITYGMTIVNNTDVPLYPTVFYFDNSDLSIKCRFDAGIAKHKVDAPLRPREPITIGHGSGGAPCFSFYFQDSHLGDVDVGFFKIFLSTEWVDLAKIIESPPITERTNAIERPSPCSNSRGMYIQEPKAQSIWDVIRITVVQRRKKETP